MCVFEIKFFSPWETKFYHAWDQCKSTEKLFFLDGGRSRRIPTNIGQISFIMRNIGTWVGNIGIEISIHVFPGFWIYTIVCLSRTKCAKQKSEMQNFVLEGHPNASPFSLKYHRTLFVTWYWGYECHIPLNVEGTPYCIRTSLWESIIPLKKEHCHLRTDLTDNFP